MSYIRGYLVDLFGEEFISTLDEEQIKRHIDNTDNGSPHRLNLDMSEGLADAKEVYVLNPDIHELIVEFDAMRPITRTQRRNKMWNNLFGLLKSNTTVIMLQFEYATDKEVEILGKILKENRYITDVAMYIHKEDPCVKRFTALAEAVRVNSTISSLAIDGSYCAEFTRGIDELIYAISINKSLRTLKLTLLLPPSVLQLASMINTTLITRLELNLVHFDEASLERFAEAMRSNKTITYLEVTPCSSIVLDQVDVLLQAISYSRSVRELHLGYDEKTRPLKSLLQLLKLNPTLSVVELSCSFQYKSQEILELADILKCNKTITSLHLILVNGPPKWIPQCIADVLVANYTLQSLKMRGWWGESISIEDETEENPVWERNKLIFQSALEFVLNPSLHGENADAFEKTRRCSALITALVERGKTETEAACLVTVANNWISSKYFILSSIVKEQIVCCDKGNVTQLDDLNNEVMSIICSYLKLADILKD